MTDGRRLFEVLRAVEALPLAAMPAAHRWVLVALANRGEEIYPSLPALSEMTGIPRSTLVRLLSQLEAAGWISRRRSPGGRTSTRYEVHLGGGPIEQAHGEQSRSEPAHSGTAHTEQAPAEPVAGSERDGSRLAASPDPPSGSPPLNSQAHSHAGGREDAPVVSEAPPVPERRPLAELGPAMADAGELSTLAATLAAEGNGLGRKVLERLAKGWTPTAPQLAALREIAAERAARAVAAPRSAPTPTDDERALVDAYLEARRRTGHGDVVALDMHHAAARRVLPDLRRLAEQAGIPWLDLAKHRLKIFFAGADAWLEAQGYDLGLLLRRTDAAGLPRPPRKAGPEREPAIVAPERERRRAPRAPPAPGSAEEAAEVAAAKMQFGALRAAVGGGQ